MEGLFDTGLLLKFVLSILFGATVGLERYMHGRPAGLRTYIIVCMAFTTLAVLSERYSLAFGPLAGNGFRPDPGRIVAGGLTGIGFLGAGIIIRSGVTVHGLTTAAAIWAISVVGLAVGAGSYDLAAILYLTTIFSLIVLRQVESRFSRDIYKTLEVTVRGAGFSSEDLEQRVREKKLEVVSTDRSENRPEQIFVFKMTLHGKGEESFHQAYRDMASLDGVQSVRLVGQNNVK